MRIRGGVYDTVCIASNSSSTSGLYFMVSCQFYTLEQSDGNPKA